MKITSFLLFLLAFSSCTSILNGPTTRIKVHSQEPIQVIVKDKTYAVDKRTVLRVDRSREDLDLIVKNDSLSKNYTLRSRKSGLYYVNIMQYGIGFILDALPSNSKKFKYRSNIYPELSATSSRLKRYPPSTKNQWNLTFSLPHANFYYFKPLGEPNVRSAGFWGLSTGLEYYYAPQKFLNFTASAVTNFTFPIPVILLLGEGLEERLRSFFFTFTNNHEVNNFSLGYGIHYANNIWELEYVGETPPPDVREVIRSSHSLGFNLNTYYRLGERFRIGLFYRPSLLRIDPDPGLKYEHLITVDFVWKWKISK